MRKALIALAAVVGLVLAGIAGYFVFRPGQGPALGAPQPTTSADQSSEPDEPVTIAVSSSGGALVAAITPDALGPIPEKLNPDDKSKSGATSCAEPSFVLEAAGARDAGYTSVSATVVPKSFQEITVTDFRVRFLSAKPGMAAPKYLYQCENPNALDYRESVEVFADGSHDEVFSLKEHTTGRFPTTVTAERVEAWSDSVDVRVLGQAYEWQVEIEYVHQGVTRTSVHKTDSDGRPFATEPAQRADDFDRNFVWCHAPERRFTEGALCQ